MIEVAIENLRDQGDGVARLPPGYVAIVPDTKVGEEDTVGIPEIPIEMLLTVSIPSLARGEDPCDSELIDEPESEV